MSRRGGGVAAPSSRARSAASSSPAPRVGSPAGSSARDGRHNQIPPKQSSGKLRGADPAGVGGGGRVPSGAAAAAGQRPSRGGKKSYVVDSDSDEDEEDEDDEEGDDEDAEGDFTNVGGRRGGGDDDDDDEDMEDAEGEDDDVMMDVDAEGDDDEVDAEGEIDVHAALPPPPQPPVPAAKSRGGGIVTPKKKGARGFKPSSTSKGGSAAKKRVAYDNGDEEDDDDLSELDSEEDGMNETVEPGGGQEEDAEGEEEEADAEAELELAEADAEADAEDVEAESGEDNDSRGGTPNIARMTARQRAKLGGISHEYMKLSDEVQAKKHFTAEELSMRRAEMARRRRNLSEKRNEEVKMETINKLLKKQAPKTNRRTAMLAGDETPEVEVPRPNPLFVRWVSSKSGTRLSVPAEMMAGPIGQVFRGGDAGVPGGGAGKMVEEVS